MSTKVGLAAGLIPGLGVELKLFKKDGTVPGPKGKPVKAIVHDGETIVPPGKTLSSVKGRKPSSYNQKDNVSCNHGPMKYFSKMKD